MIKSIIESFQNLFKSPSTLDYPRTSIVKSESHRGLIAYDASHCTFCDKCEKTCPPNAIIFTQSLDGVKTYHYNPHLCIYCGDCVRACPESGSALWQSREKPAPATLENEPNRSWRAIQAQGKESRLAYKAHKE